jgi:hypothetical protein
MQFLIFLYFSDVEVQYNPDYTICSYGTRKLRNYKAFLTDFFEFYSEFDFGSRFISVVDGRAYAYNLVSDNPDMNRPMSVSSIFENHINAAKLLSAKKLKKFQQICGEAPDILNEYDI